MDHNTDWLLTDWNLHTEIDFDHKVSILQVDEDELYGVIVRIIYMMYDVWMLM